MEHVDAVLFPSLSSMELHHRAGFDRRSIHLPEFAPDRVTAAEPGGSQQDPRPYFLFVGRMERLKGLQTLIPVFRRNRRARLLIAGDGGMLSELVRMAEGLGNIEFLGQVSAEVLVALYRRAVAVIVPSLTYESFSLVTVEAFREHTPVLARNLGGPKELLEESGGGILFDTDDQLQAAVDRLLDDPQLRDDLATRGEQAYRQKWTEAVHLQRYLSIIAELA